jgi:arylsulfate sulfotransferase
MRSNAQYTATHTLDSGSTITTGPQVAFATADGGLQPPVVSILKDRTAPPLDSILLQSTFAASPVATDLAGNIVWSGPSDITFLTRPDSGGRFLGIGEDGTQDTSHQFFREFDLAGVTLAETNAARLNEQLAALGVHSISGFHHEARRLPNGGYLVLADSERILTNLQGAGPVDVIGDTILVLDHNLQVAWTWDAFDHMDTSRAALLGETCTGDSGLACAPFYMAPTANDWLHGNSLQLTPDGNILYSARHQDWVLKIDYENGLGTGAILWKLGNQGDFQISSSDPNPWFSHQHDPNFEANGATLTLYDDGNERAATDPNAHSRGQALVVDEQGRTAKLILNADLGTYSPAVGSAQKLSDGHYHFDSGYIADPSGNGARISQSIEVNAAGAMVYGIQIGEAEYRTFRMRDLYTAP